MSVWASSGISTEKSDFRLLCLPQRACSGSRATEAPLLWPAPLAQQIRESLRQLEAASRFVSRRARQRISAAVHSASLNPSEPTAASDRSECRVFR